MRILAYWAVSVLVGLGATGVLLSHICSRGHVAVSSWSPDRHSCPNPPQYRCREFFKNSGSDLSASNAIIWDPPFIAMSWRTGNRLSSYWNSRAMAYYGGHSFVMGPRMRQIFKTSWQQYLPDQVPAAACPSPAEYYAGCVGCSYGRTTSENYMYPHICNGAWITFRRHVQLETHQAVHKWMLQIGNSSLDFKPRADIVVQFRCASDTLAHEEYGPLAHSCYDVIPSNAKTILILADPQVKGTHACEKMLAGLQQHLNAHWPNTPVVVSSGSIENDFITMLLAPVLIRSSQSSFGLWAGFASQNVVWSAPMVSNLAANSTPDFGPNWHWINCPVLYPSIARAANMSLNSVDEVLHWLQNN